VQQTYPILSQRVICHVAGVGQSAAIQVLRARPWYKIPISYIKYKHKLHVHESRDGEKSRGHTEGCWQNTDGTLIPSCVMESGLETVENDIGLQPEIIMANNHQNKVSIVCICICILTNRTGEPPVLQGYKLNIN